VLNFISLQISAGFQTFLQHMCSSPGNYRDEFFGCKEKQDYVK